MYTCTWGGDDFPLPPPPNCSGTYDPWYIIVVLMYMNCTTYASTHNYATESNGVGLENGVIHVYIATSRSYAKVPILEGMHDLGEQKTPTFVSSPSPALAFTLALPLPFHPTTFLPMSCLTYNIGGREEGGLCPLVFGGV